MKFYIASSFNNVEEVRELANRLKAEGHVHSYDWTRNGRVVTLEALQSIGQKELDAVSGSDVLIILLPAGKGSHIELGIALGLSKRVYLYSPGDDIYDFGKTSTFYHLDTVDKFVGSFVDFTAYVLKKECFN